MALGHPGIDLEHRQLGSLLEQLASCPEKGFLECLDAVAAHLGEHFAMEDGLMADCDFSTRQCHVDEHAAVLASIAEVRALVVEGRSEVGRRLAVSLRDWFPGHVEALDQALVKFLFQRQTGGAAVMIRRRG